MRNRKGSVIPVVLLGDHGLISVTPSVTLRDQAFNNWVLGLLALVIVVQVLRRYRIVRYLNP